MNAFLESVAQWLVDYLAAATLLLAAALALRTFVRQPAARMAVAWSACLGLIAMALLTAWPTWPRVRVDDLAQIWPNQVAAASFEQPVAGQTPEELPAEVVSLLPAPTLTEEVAASPTPAQLPTAAVQAVAWNHLLSAAWLTFAACAIGWMLLGWARARDLVANAIQAPAWVRDELRRIVSGQTMPQILASKRVNSAVALGALSPKIVLPQESVIEANAPAVRAALAHEWAHIRHRDLWLLAVERALLPLVGVHPLFWWLRRSLRLDQELLADAAAAGNEPAEYAAALLAWAKTAQPARHGLAALSMWEHPSTLSRRVNMILNAKRPLTRPLGRGLAAALAGLLAALVLGLSLVTLRAQDDTPSAEAPAEAADPVPKVEVRKYRELPGPVPAAGTLPVTQVHLNLLVMCVNREKLVAAETTLEEAIAEATESRCRKEAGLVVSEIKPEEVVRLLDRLKKHDAVKVVSRPSILTLDGREANLHIGGEAPILRVEETINGKHEQRVEYKEFGTMLLVRPKLSGEKGDLVTLDIVAEQASLLPPGEAAEEGAVPRDVPGLVSHKFKLTSDVKLGGSLLVAESPAGKKQLRDALKQQFLLIVTPQRAVRTVAAVYADPRAGDKGEAARAATEAALEAATATETAREPQHAQEVGQQQGEQGKQQQQQGQPGQPGQKQGQQQPGQGERQPGQQQQGQQQPGQRQQGQAGQQGQRGQQQLTTVDMISTVAIDQPIAKIEFSLSEGDPVAIAASIEAAAARAKLHSLKVIPIRDPKPARIVAIVPKSQLQAATALMIAAVQGKDETGHQRPVEIQDFVERQPPAADQLAGPRRQRATASAAANRPPPKTAVDRDRAARDDSARIAEHDLAQANLAEEAALKEYLRVATAGDPSPQERDAKKIAWEQAKIEVGRAAAKLEGARATSSAPATGTPRPTANPAAQADPRQVNWGLLTADVAEARLDLERAEKEFSRVEQLKAAKAISQAEFDAKQYDLERAKIQLRRAEAKLFAPAADGSAGTPERRKLSQQTEVKLLELDLADAKLAVEEAESELQRVDQLRKQSPSAVSEQEIRKYQFQTDRAKIQVQRIMIKLEAAKAESETPR